jgi:glutaredoxin-like protein
MRGKKNKRLKISSFIPDGNGEFTEKMGLLVDKESLGFGKRLWRYSMLVKDGVIAKMFIEPNKAGDPFEVSDADTMLKFIAPNAQLPKEVTIFTKPGCPHCKRAKKLLNDHKQGYEEVVIGHGASMRTVKALTNRQTVPQIYIDGQHIGGADDLEKYYSSK